MEAILPGTHKSHPSPRFWFRTIASRSQWSRLSRHHNSCLCLSCPHNQSLSQYHHRSGLQWRDARLQWGGQEAICQPWWIKAEQIQQPWSNLQVWIDNLTHHHKYNTCVSSVKLFYHSRSEAGGFIYVGGDLVILYRNFRVRVSVIKWKFKDNISIGLPNYI